MFRGKNFRRINPGIMSSLFLMLFLFNACEESIPTGPNLPDFYKGYDYFYAGNPSDALSVPSSGLVLMGGGRDVDEAFVWMIKKSGGGDFVVLRASGTDAYNSYIYNLGRVDSVETIIVYTPQGASDEFVINKIKSAEALFIAGGDQAKYLRNWKGTPLNEAINYAIRRGAVIGGTSAGLAVLGEFIFPAYNGTVYSPEALANPYNSYMTLERDFLDIPLLKNVITDSHFVTRDRMGRLVVFLARIIKDRWSLMPRGIGVDEATALLVEPDGSTTVVGTGAVYFLLADHMPEVCQPATPLTFSLIPVYKVQAGGYFNLATWQGSGGLSYYVSATSGTLSSSTGSIY